MLSQLEDVERRYEDLTARLSDPKLSTQIEELTKITRERAKLEEVDPTVDVREAAQAKDAGGWLRIGDRALVEALSDGAPPAFNPSEAWTQDTGLPFVFATWLVRPGVELTPEVGPDLAIAATS